jgi:acetyl-CoA C-acetyltransferase
LMKRAARGPGRTIGREDKGVVCDLGLPKDRTNPSGSGISLGHPIGATGCILTVKALHELQRTGGRYALVTMCIGGGQGIAAIYERL